MHYFLKMHVIKQWSSDASRYHQVIVINSGWFACVGQSEKIFPSWLIHPNGRENRKLGTWAKTARLKATVRELLGFLHRKAPLAAQTVDHGGEKGSLPRHVFHTRNRFMGSLRNFRGPHYRASGGVPSSRISGINSTLCDIQICAVEFFQSNEILLRSPSSPCFPSLEPNLLLPCRYASLELAPL